MPGTNETSVIADQVSAFLEGQIWSRNHVTSHERFQVPAEWQDDRYIVVQAFGEAVWMVFGDSAVTAVVNARNATTGVAGNLVLTPTNGIAWRIEPGIPEPIIVPKLYLDSTGASQAVTHCSHISDAGAAGAWQVRLSGNR